MILLIVEKVPASLRGELSRWLMEIATGVFLGRVSALVREELWMLACKKRAQGGVVMVHPWPNEQGFAVKSIGKLSRIPVDMDGLTMIRRPLKAKRGPKTLSET